MIMDFVRWGLLAVPRPLGAGQGALGPVQHPQFLQHGDNS